MFFIIVTGLFCCVLVFYFFCHVLKNFSVYYSHIGRPSVPIRKMVGLLLLKHIYNLSDEAVLYRWIENPYWQYFSGEKIFQKDKPFDPTEFIHFRKRIGKEGVEELLKISIHLFGKEAQEKEVLIDSTTLRNKFKLLCNHNSLAV